MITSTDDFLKVMEDSGVVSSDTLAKAVRKLEEEGVDLKDASTLANSLISDHTLTRWQAEKLLQGRHQGFVLGSYRILSLLGRGSMGTVYLAEHTLMKRQVALKVLPFDHLEQPSFLDRFIREAQAGAMLDHPNIVRSFDVGKESDGTRDVYFLAMEYIRGRSLVDVVRQDGPLSFERAADYARQVAEGLAHAHEISLIHRDIKPGNLLVDKNEVVRILDLGLAFFHTADQDESASITMSNNDYLLGTADYISPEQALNSHDVDSRTDIYSLGCTLYFMLTGHPPFRHGTVPQRLMAHQTKLPPPISETRSDAPQHLTDIVERMLAKLPDDRFQSCRELANTLSTWLDEHADPDWNQPTSASILDRPIPAQTPSDTMAGPVAFDDAPLRTTSVDNSESRRSPVPFVLGGFVLIVIVVGVLWSLGLHSIEDQNPPEDLVNKTSDAKSIAIDQQTPGAKTQPIEKTNTVQVEPIKPPAPIETPFTRWQAFARELKADPATVLYLSFPERTSDSHGFKNEAKAGRMSDLEFQPKVACEWLSGRWPETNSLRFTGTEDGQYLAISRDESKPFNFASSFSVLVWFRVDEFTERYQALVTKGDFGFRLSRYGTFRGMAFSINRWWNKQDQVTFTVMAEAKDRKYPVDDGKWHLAVGVVDVNGDKVTVSLFVDGELRSSVPSQGLLSPNDAPVLIGANSMFLKDKPRNEKRTVNQARQFKGNIDEVAILSRALTAEEIARVYELGTAPQP